MVSEVITPGTNIDVFSFPELKTHALHYHNLPDDFNMFGTSTFYIDYMDAVSKSYEKFKNPDVDNVRQVVPNYLSGESDLSKFYYESFKWVYIYLAWNNWFTNTRMLPEPFLLTQEYFDLIDKGFVADDNQKINYRLIGRVGSRSLQVLRDNWDNSTVQEKINLVSSIGHYPSMANSGLFEESVFFDPSDRKKSEYIVSMYTRENAFNVIEALLKARRVVHYSEIIKPVDYGFVIDFSAIGINARYSIQFPHSEWFTKQYLRQKAYDTGRIDSNGYKRFEIYDSAIPPPGLAMEPFHYRDEWISYWLRGGYIPYSKENICNQNGTMKSCWALRHLFPVYLQPVAHSWSFFDYFGAVLNITGFALGAYMAISNGNYRSLTKIFINPLLTVLKQKMPSISRYVDAAAIFAVAPIMKKYIPESKKITDSTKFLMSMMQQQVNQITYTEVEFQTETAVGNIYKNLNERQRRISIAISEALQPENSQIVINSEPEDAAQNVSGGISKDVLLSAGIIGGALLLKKLK